MELRVLEQRNCLQKLRVLEYHHSHKQEQNTVIHNLLIEGIDTFIAFYYFTVHQGNSNIYLFPISSYSKKQRYKKVLSSLLYTRKKQELIFSFTGNTIIGFSLNAFTGRQVCGFYFYFYPIEQSYALVYMLYQERLLVVNILFPTNPDQQGPGCSTIPNLNT